MIMISRNSSSVVVFLCPLFFLLFSLVRFTCLKQLHPYLPFPLSLLCTPYQVTPNLRNDLFDLLFQILVHLLFWLNFSIHFPHHIRPYQAIPSILRNGPFDLLFRSLVFFFCSTYLSISVINVRHAYICSL